MPWKDLSNDILESSVAYVEKMLHSVAKVAKKAYKLPFFTFLTRRMVKIYFLHQIFWKALERPFKWHIGKFCSISRKKVTLHYRKSLTFCPIIVDLRHCETELCKSSMDLFLIIFQTVLSFSFKFSDEYKYKVTLHSKIALKK